MSIDETIKATQQSIETLQSVRRRATLKAGGAFVAMGLCIAGGTLGTMASGFSAFGFAVAQGKNPVDQLRKRQVCAILSIATPVLAGLSIAGAGWMGWFHLKPNVKVMVHTHSQLRDLHQRLITFQTCESAIKQYQCKTVQ